MKEEITTRCPNCETGTAERVEKERQGEEVTATLTCDECDNEWTHVLRFE
ncbi:hypothetical protein [Natronococcus wangiae]|nr:hypothetical protein [Natronococcus sp. AD5]